MTAYSLADFLTKHNDEDIRSVLTTNEKDKQQLELIYATLWENLLKEIAIQLLKEAIKEYEKERRKSWYLIFRSTRRQQLDDDYQTFITQHDKLHNGTLSAASFLARNPLASRKATFMNFSNEFTQVKNWFESFTPSKGNATIDPQKFNKSNFTQLQNMELSQAKACAHSMEDAANMVESRILTACKNRIGLEKLQTKIKNIPCLNETAHPNPILTLSYIKTEYPDASASTILTQSTTQTVPIKTPRTNTFYSSLSSYLQQETTQIQSNSEAQQAIRKHAKATKRFIFWGPSEQSTLTKLLNAAEQSNLSDQDFIDITRRLERLKGYQTDKRKHTTTQHSILDEFNAFFTYKKISSGFMKQANDQATTSIHQFGKLQDIERSKEVISQLEQCAGISPSSSVTLDDLMTFAEKRRENNPFIISNDNQEMMRQIYFILFKHQPGYMTISANGYKKTLPANALLQSGDTFYFNNDLTSCLDTNDQLCSLSQLHNTLISFSNHELTFNILLLAKTLLNIKDNNPQSYALLRDALITALKSTKINFNDIVHQDSPLGWLKKYVSRNPITLTENARLEISTTLDLLLPKAIITSEITPVKSPSSRVSTPSSTSSEQDFLRKQALHILSYTTKRGVNMTKKYVSLADLDATLSTYLSDETAKDLTDEKLKQVYVLCQYYIRERTGSKTNSSSETEIQIVTTYCKNIIKSIQENGNTEAAVRNNDEFNGLIKKKGSGFSGTRLYETLNGIVTSLERKISNGSFSSCKTTNDSESRHSLSYSPNDTFFSPSVDTQKTNSTLALIY